jgi:phenylacetate-coenzyme A ligase PaaK-like adenylate-forming protein
MADYEVLRQRHVARLLEAMPEHVARMTWSVEQLQAGRERGLRALVDRARTRSPWHGRRLAGVDPDRLRETDLRTLPVMTKDDLMEHFDEVVTDRRLTRNIVEAHLAALSADAYLLDEYHVCASGGSSGRRGAFVYDFEAWAIAWASMFRFTMGRTAELLGPDAAPAAVAVIAAEKASHMTAAFRQTFRLPGVPVNRLSATWPLARIVATLNECQPEFLYGYASIIHQLAGEAVAGRLRVAPRMVGTTSEPLLPEMRAAIAAAWGVPILNVLGTTEGLFGVSCTAGRGLHLNDDVCIIEPVDGSGNPVPPGHRAAKIYLTNLYNLAMPLIRYELTDEVTVLSEPCPCGVTLLRIDDIEGRLDDCFTYPGGAIVHPFTFRSPLGRERDIVEYQVHQTVRGADILIRCQGPVDTARLAGTIRDALAGLGVSGAEVSVTPVEGLERQTTGKLRRFVPLPPGASGA